MATQVMCRWAVAVIEKLTKHLGGSGNAKKTPKKLSYQPINGGLKSRVHTTKMPFQ